MFPSAAAMAQSQKPETFMLSTEAQQSLPQDAQVALQQVDNLKYFLISAPVDWAQDSLIRRFLLPTGEYVSCVLWNNLFHVSGTDIVRCLAFRFQAFGRPVKNSKKFEEGIFSDLRNLKAGTDASLEEPKSPFLDFLYKNNCIRTQKKQKVFYWYSVPHDRLFLDALERDLKREKMGQEATTKAISEPALSFEFDSSQSLFEQLTKAQQAQSSSFAGSNSTPAPQINPSQSASPMLRATDSMPPPQMIPQQISRPQDHQSIYNMLPPQHQPQHQPHPHMTHEPLGQPIQQDYAQQVYYDRNSHMRHSSMPAFMEYSPAPSFVSSHYGDSYSARGVSYEPITPPQQAVSHGHEPAYIANEETGLYTAIPDMNQMHHYNPMPQMPPTSMSGPSFAPATRTFGPTYPMMEGSPTYKARRRRSSIPSSIMNAVAANATAQLHKMGTAHAPQRPSDLRRSMSSSVVPMHEHENTATPPPSSHPYPSTLVSREQFQDYSRHSTPLASLEEDASGPMQFPSFNEDYTQSLQTSPASAQRPGPIRRARSATMMELGMPYKSHSCPIPACGRLFKRLEHLKRHVRTHTQERPYVCNVCSKAFSRSDNLAQ